MGIFSNILAKIFPSDHPAAATPAADAAPPAPANPGAPASSTPVSAAPPIAAMPEVDVAHVLEDLAAKQSEKLNWRTSIVDLMKLLGLDSSLGARKALATELHYSGDANDSATMNMWLHKQVMTKLASNGGKVPAELKD